MKPKEPIKNYILMVYYDFKKFINEKNDLCLLKDLDYQAGQMPNYSDVHLQQFYLLRYSYAYAYEYKTMFAQLLQRQEWTDCIEVTSIGCGNQIDYWGLAEALEESKNDSCQIKYTGIDVIDWKKRYRIQARQGDKMEFKQENISSVLKKETMLNSDVYIFPKSISEFSEEEFREICREFGTKKFTKQKVHILISLRSNEYSLEMDTRRSEKIILSMKQNGFMIKEGTSTDVQSIENEKSIWKADNKFEYYPRGVIYFLTSLNTKCCFSGSCTKNCEETLTRHPMLTVKNIRYQILSFDRKDSQ